MFSGPPRSHPGIPLRTARQKKDRKLEKKYLEKFVDVAPEDEKAAAQARLDFLKS